MTSIQVEGTSPEVLRTSQTLWHVGRPGSPPVTAVLMRAAVDEYMLDVTFGTVARQRVRFGNSVAAIEHAERLLAQLENVGYQRQRRDKREGPS
jgi:hypothetical protein